ncbi:alcohol oxidase [Lentinula aciculospora]|uniref:Alcohol oxidase n=1 Tax=Lentinula aciculospora TaxID=153920 RepID=A0A9W8ZZL4_9AGAR|nr:alcohol oxidase [Lentinula aciculospora]
MRFLAHFLWSSIFIGSVQATIITDDLSKVVNLSFEFIVVGGGTTGLAAANRLALNHSVLVVERGQNLVDNEVVNDPFAFAAGTPSPCRFSMNSTPQNSVDGTYRSLPLFYGSCLGGSSSINGMMGARPTFASMNAIEALGNPGWGWNDFLPYMQRSENFTPPNPSQIEEGANYIAAVHGYHGPVGVSFARPFVAPVLQRIAKKTTQTVFGGEVTLTPDMGDGFSGGHVSSFYYQIHFNETLHSDRRSSSAWSYLYPQAQQRTGLTVLTAHQVNSVLTSASASGNIIATGVLVEPTIGGPVIMINASREVVITAGALQSPVILQRSGIGNATFLRTIRIESVLDLPGVGANLQDHIGLYNTSFPLAPYANTTNVTGGANVLAGIVVAQPTAQDTLGLKDATALNILLRNLSTEHAVSVGGVVNSESLATQAAVIAEAYEIDRMQSFQAPLWSINQQHIVDPFIEIFYSPGSVYLQVAAHTILPLSRGTIRINTTDPSADPTVDMQFLTSEVDIHAAVAAARRISLIAATPPFSELIAENALKESGVPDVNATEEEVRKWVLETYESDIHFEGSHSMLPKELGGVVSPQLLVYGTKNLRIADASILPLSVFPHPTLGLYGVAEKAADMILQTIDTC